MRIMIGKEKAVPVTVKLPPEPHLACLDRLLERERERHPGRYISRGDVVRRLILEAVK